MMGEVVINFTPRRYEEIFTELMMTAFTRGLLSSDEKILAYAANKEDIENTLILELSVHALILSYVYNDLEAIYRAQDISLAEGKDLDVLGNLYMPRRPSTPARTEVVFYGNPVGHNIEIPAGQQIKTTGEEEVVVFQTIADGIIYDGLTSVQVPVECIVTGPIGNVAPGAITDLVTPISGITSLTNPTGGTGGKRIETDYDYRQRLFNWPYVLKRGTYDAIVEAIHSVPAVEGFYIERFTDGYGSTKIVIDPPLQSIMDNVISAVDSVKAIDEELFFEMVTTVPIDISANINISIDSPVPVPKSRKDIVKIKVEQALATYLDGGRNIDGTPQKALGIGTDFIAFKAGVYLSQQLPEIKEVEFEFPKKPITIHAYEKATIGSLNIKVD